MCSFPRRSGRPPPSRSPSWTRLRPSGNWGEAEEKKGVSAMRRHDWRPQTTTRSRSALLARRGERDESCPWSEGRRFSPDALGHNGYNVTAVLCVNQPDVLMLQKSEWQQKKNVGGKIESEMCWSKSRFNPPEEKHIDCKAKMRRKLLQQLPSQGAEGGNKKWIKWKTTGKHTVPRRRWWHLISTRPDLRQIVLQVALASF